MQAPSAIGGHQQQGSGMLPGELPIAIAVQPGPGVTVGSFPVALHTVIGGVGVASAPPQAPAVGTAASASLTDMNSHVPNLGANKLGSEPSNMCSSMADNMGDAAVSNLVAGDALPAASAAMALPAQAGVLAPGRALEHDKDLGLDVSSSIVSSQLAPPTLSDMCAAAPVGAEYAHDVMVAAAAEGEGAGGDEEADNHGGGAAGLGAEDGGMDAGVVGVEAEVHVADAEPDAAEAAVTDADAAAEHAAAEQAEVEHHAAEHAAAEQAAVDVDEDAEGQDADAQDEASPDEDVQTVRELQEAGVQAEAAAAEDVGDVAAEGGDEDETVPECEVNEDAPEVGQHVPVADEGCGDTSMPASLEERVADEGEGVVSAEVVAQMEEEAGGHEREQAGSCEAVDEAGAAVSQSFQEEAAEEVAQHVNEHVCATDDCEMGPPEL
jgi:hypothetical protein